MHRGYIKLWRKTLDSGLLQNGPAWQLFGYLLLKAAYKPQRQLVGSTMYELEPGQLIFSRTKAAADLKLGEQQVRTALALLRKLDVVTGRTTNQCTVITIMNWHHYQADAPGTNQRDDARPVEEMPAEPSDETTICENAKNQPATNRRDNQPPNQRDNRQNRQKTRMNPGDWENNFVAANQPSTGRATGGPRQNQPAANQRLTGGPSLSDQIKEFKNIKNIKLRSASGGADAAHALPLLPGENSETASEAGTGGGQAVEAPARVPPGKGGAAEGYRTKKGRLLTGKRLASFERFWSAFAYPRGKAEAADAWLDIPALTDALVARICAAARKEAERREELVARGHTPKMAQGWISGRRWEDYEPERPPERTEDAGTRPLRAVYDDGRPVEGPPTPEERAANEKRMEAMREKLRARGLIRGECPTEAARAG